MSSARWEPPCGCTTVTCSSTASPRPSLLDPSLCTKEEAGGVQGGPGGCWRMPPVSSLATARLQGGLDQGLRGLGVGSLSGRIMHRRPMLRAGAEGLCPCWAGSMAGSDSPTPGAGDGGVFLPLLLGLGEAARRGRLAGSPFSFSPEVKASAPFCAEKSAAGTGEGLNRGGGTPTPLSWIRGDPCVCIEADPETCRALAWGTAATGAWGLGLSPTLRAGGRREPALGFSAWGLAPLLPQAEKVTQSKGSAYPWEETARGVSPRAPAATLPLPWGPYSPAGGIPGSPLQHSFPYSALPVHGALVVGEGG